ncbi:hypothetical protein [Planctomycetes bacterium K23_9]|uniref:Uncharacterized protein n=1 Tax=Stieleria marina TaxID=1930275 RepID=A0A517NW28_9BACT|nr:hypothetical protein K239x_33300 [Planctomycetes bacterium K23_9]
MAANDSGRPLPPAPELCLLWESQRFPIRSLSTKQFVVRCESMVRGHDPNQLAPVMNGTLMSDFGEDIAVLFRVCGTDQKFARCQLAALSHSKTKRIERLNSAWQSALARAAEKRAQQARRKREQERQAEIERLTKAQQIADQKAAAAQASAIASATTPVPESDISKTQLPANPAPENAPAVAPIAQQSADAVFAASQFDASQATATTAAASSESSLAPDGKPPAHPPASQRSNLARYCLASLIALAVVGLLFARGGGDKKLAATNQQQTEQQQTGTAPQSLASTPTRQQDRADTSQITTPDAAYATAHATANDPALDPTHDNAPDAGSKATSVTSPETPANRRQPTQSVAQAAPTNVDVPVMPTIADQASMQRTERRIERAQAQLAQLTKQRESALADQASAIEKTQAEKAGQLAAAKSELTEASQAVTKLQKLLRDLAPLIADENIGTAEVEKIEQDLVNAKARQAEKKAAVQQLRQSFSAAGSSVQQETLSAIQSRMRLIQQDINQLTRDRDRLKILATGKVKQATHQSQ